MLTSLRRKPIAIVTVILLLVAIGVAIYWAFKEQHPEPWLTLFVLLATIIGVFGDRWISERERRSATLKVVAEELFKNTQVLSGLRKISEQDDVRRLLTLPRFYISSLELAVASGIFATDKDAKLNKLMHTWLSIAHQTNQRISVSEALYITDQEGDLGMKFLKKLGSSEVMRNSAMAIRDLALCLMDDYSDASGIDRNTVIFPDVGEG